MRTCKFFSARKSGLIQDGCRHVKPYGMKIVSLNGNVSDFESSESRKHVLESVVLEY